LFFSILFKKECIPGAPMAFKEIKKKRVIEIKPKVGRQEKGGVWGIHKYKG